MSAAEQDKFDPAVVAALYVDHGDELRVLLAGVLRNADLVSEALQATFTRALETGHSAQKETRKGWLFRVAVNEALALKRKQKRDSDSTRRIAAETGTEESLLPSPDGVMARLETVEQVRRSLDSLPEEQRRIVRMRIYEGQTFAEIARTLNLPLGTVLTRMRLALRRLADTLKSEDPAG